MASKLYDYTPTELQKLLDESDSYADVLRTVGLSTTGGNTNTLKKVILKLDLDESKLNENRHNLFMECVKHADNFKKKYSLEDILNGEHPNYNGSHLMARLVKEGYKERKCERCGITEWMEQPISFQLHHKDGNHSNNKLENLEVLCPNCHSQTDGYAGRKNKNKEIVYSKKHKGYKKDLCPVCNKNMKSQRSSMCLHCAQKEMRKPKVSKEELFEIMETNSYYSAAKLLGVDIKTVSRWHKYYTNKERENDNMVIGSDVAPSREVLKTKIRTMSFVQIGKEYNVTDNSVRKWCDTYGLPRRVSEIKSISDEEWEKI